jgi:F-type H+-transporting ATPase subunit b
VLTAVVTQTGSSSSVEILGDVPASAWVVAEVEPPEKDLNPIFPEMKEVAWGFGSFVVFALLMRFVLFPKLKKGMDDRYHGIRADHEAADAMRAAAHAEVADYEAKLAAVKAEAAAIVDAARQQLETERQAQLSALNARLAEARAAAAAQTEQARAAAQDQIRAAVTDVAGRVGELALGRRPNAEVVDRVVTEVMSK